MDIRALHGSLKRAGGRRASWVVSNVFHTKKCLVNEWSFSYMKSARDETAVKGLG